MRYYCTYFDRAFLPRALALYESLVRHAGEFRLWALCLDEPALAAARRLDLPGLLPVALDELEREDPELAAVKSSRSPLEYCFTCSPCLPRFLLRRHPAIDRLTYLDADLYFYSDPAPLHDELGGASVGIIPHGFSPGLEDRARFGRYNVGWISYRHDASALECLDWWRARCLEWCHARVEPERYADQKYLDQWPQLFSGVRALEHPGANLGPWNLRRRHVTEKEGRVSVNGQPLVFFHFSSFLQVAPWLYNTNLGSWGVRPSRVVRRRIIEPYVAALHRVAAPGTLGACPATPALSVGEPAKRASWPLRKLRGLGVIARGLVTRQHLLVLNGRVL